MKSAYYKAYFWEYLTFAKETCLGIINSIGGAFFNQEKQLDLARINRILVIHGEHSSIGDAVLFSAIFPPLRKKFKNAKIDLLIRTPADKLFQNKPEIDEVMPYDSEEAANLLTQEFAPLKIVEKLKKKRYDLVITSEHAQRFILLSYLIGAPNRVGLDLSGRGFLLTKKVHYPKYFDRTKRELEYYLDLVRALGIDALANKSDMALGISGSDRKKAGEFIKLNHLQDAKFILGIHPGGGIWKKRWPAYNFAKLADRMVEKYGCSVIAFGGKEDGLLVEQIQKIAKAKISNAAGKLSILQTVAVLEKCKLVVANDSAISHLASTTNAKVLALFGVDSPIRWGPFGNDSIMRHKRLEECGIICNYDYLYAIDDCFADGEPYCMAKIKVEDVMADVKKILNK